MAFSKYLFEYWHQGKKWSIAITAESAADASERIEALQRAKYAGVQIMEIPASAGFLARAIVSVRNFIKRRPVTAEGGE